MIRITHPASKRIALALAFAVSAGVFALTPALAQNQQMEQKLMAIKTAQDANKAKLAQYTWTETETISIKGDVKDTKTYQVQMVNGNCSVQSAPGKGTTVRVEIPLAEIRGAKGSCQHIPNPTTTL